MSCDFSSSKGHIWNLLMLSSGQFTPPVVDILNGFIIYLGSGLLYRISMGKTLV